MPRRFPIFQFPNVELATAVGAGAIARTSAGDGARAAEVISRVAALVWGAEELLHGANWFRRLLGVGGVAYALGVRVDPEWRDGP